MNRLPFNFYVNIYEEIDELEAHLSQLQRDYKREFTGEELLFAVDFSEIYEYMHFNRREAQRSAINAYVLNHSSDKFTMLPGSVGELFNELEKLVPGRGRAAFDGTLDERPAAKDFIERYKSFPNQEEFINHYARAERELEESIPDILDALTQNGRFYSAVDRIRRLLAQGKLLPIQGVTQIDAISPEVKRLYRLVDSHLAVSRPRYPESNQIDATDFIVALLLNQMGKQPGKRYVSIYSQAKSLIQACRSHVSLQWESDYLIREAQYFKYRTKLQELFPSLQERYDHVVAWYHLCQKLRSEISELVDVDEKLQERAAEPSLKLMDDYRRLKEECIDPLKFIVDEKEITTIKAQSIYHAMLNEKSYEGRPEETFAVLQEHFRQIQREFQSFTPIATDSVPSKQYKANLRRWLGLDDLDDSEKNRSEQEREKHDDAG